MDEETTIEYRGVRIDLAHMDPVNRRPMIREAQRWIEQGERPPLLTVSSNGEDVSEQPNRWPARVRDYRGPGRLEWVGDRDRART